MPESRNRRAFSMEMDRLSDPSWRWSMLEVFKRRQQLFGVHRRSVVDWGVLKNTTMLQLSVQGRVAYHI